MLIGTTHITNQLALSIFTARTDMDETVYIAGADAAMKRLALLRDVTEGSIAVDNSGYAEDPFLVQYGLCELYARLFEDVMYNIALDDLTQDKYRTAAEYYRAEQDRWEKRVTYGSITGTSVSRDDGISVMRLRRS